MVKDTACNGMVRLNKIPDLIRVTYEAECN
nr:MAG TPA: hypothetical protein [Herelleviridae sp.]